MREILELMDPDQQTIIEKVAKEVKRKFEGEGSGHDWWHMVRVWNMAKHLGTKEGGDRFVIELAALLHDIADQKFHNGDDTVGPQTARRILEEHAVYPETVDHVCNIIANVSFKGSGVRTEMTTLEGRVVQDSDRLDALGATGVARAFTYGGHMDRLMYDPNEKPSSQQSKEEYYNNKSSTINHFYEKLLLLKDRMNTETAKKLAQDRHQFMEEYLNRFFREWNGEI